MFRKEIKYVECPACDGMGKWWDDDEDFGTRLISCDPCRGEGSIPEAEHPDYEAPTFEEALDDAFTELAKRIVRVVDTQAKWGQFAGIAQRARIALNWSAHAAHHQSRVLNMGVSHETTMWALWTIAQIEPGAQLRFGALSLNPKWPGSQAFARQGY